MKVNQLMDAIENIDDRYIEESAYGVRRKSHIPWGLIATAACFCLAIGTGIFLQSMGILPHLNGTEGTSQPVTTEPSTTTLPSETTLPPETTLPQANPTKPPETRPSVEEVFAERGSWHNIALAGSYQSPQEIRLSSVFSRTFDGDPVVLTAYEKEALKELLDGAGAGKITRYTAEQIDEVLLLCYNKAAAELGLDLESHFTYLEKTDCYYSLYWGTPGIRIENLRAEECEDGTVNLYFHFGYDRVAKLQPHETGYYILSIERYVDNTGKTEDQIAMEALFGDYQSWYNRALACEYDSPRELSLCKFFYTGFDDESGIPTDHEWEQLKNNTGFNINYELFRLPVEKMNAVLTEYFGITLEDVEPEGFDGLVYLESTNCYYFMTTGWLGVENFEALSVTQKDDGTICVEYQCDYPTDTGFEVTMKPNGDGYQILSNVTKDPS